MEDSLSYLDKSLVGEEHNDFQWKANQGANPFVQTGLYSSVPKQNTLVCHSLKVNRSHPGGNCCQNFHPCHITQWHYKLVIHVPLNLNLLPAGVS